MPKNIIVTGGSGVAGKWVVKDLLDHGHQVLNLDRTVLRDSAARTLLTDLTDAGQVFNALASTTVGHEFAGELKPAPIDAIIHFAAIPRVMICPDNEVFRINVMSTYNVLDTASSSQNTSACQSTCHWTKTTRSIRWTAMPCPRW